MIQVVSPCEQQNVLTGSSQVYSTNTLGAALGAWAAGFLLMPHLGLLGTWALMAAFNGGIFLFLYLSIAQPVAQGRLWKPPPADYQRLVPKMTAPLILLSVFLIGFIAIGCEVIWNKSLSLFLGTNIFGTALTLSLFLWGIAVGAWLVSLTPTSIHRLKLYLVLVALSIPAIGLSSYGLNQAPLWVATWGADDWWSSPLTGKSIVAGLILFPATALFGALLPLAISVLKSHHTSAAFVGGRVYAANTWGGILGALSVGLLAVPQWGSAATLNYLQFALWLVLLGICCQCLRREQWRVIAPMTAALAGLAMIFSPPLRLQNLISIVEYSYQNSDITPANLKHHLASTELNLRYWAEGTNAIISLHHELTPEGELDKDRLVLRSNGLAESFYDLANPGVVPKYEALLAIAPYLFHAQPEKAFVVGYGGGYSVELLSSLGVKTVDVAEIEQAIVDASDHVYLGVTPLLERPNIHLRIQDARLTLNLAPRQSYDLIVSQPSHSWMSGVANLFTHETFELVRTRLQAGGIFAQWLNLYNMDETTLQSVLHSFYSVFPFGMALTRPGDDQVILLGSLGELQLQVEKLQALSTDRFWQERLLFVPLNRPEDFFSYYAMNRQQALTASAGAPLNTDNNVFAEVRQSQLFYKDQDFTRGLQSLLSTTYELNQSNREQLPVNPTLKGRKSP
jgi:spermidine synthase